MAGTFSLSEPTIDPRKGNAWKSPGPRGRQVSAYQHVVQAFVDEDLNT